MALWQIKGNEVVDGQGRLIFRGVDADTCMKYIDDNWVVDQTPAGTPLTRSILSKAFDRVADKTNWKNPIRATIRCATMDEIDTIGKAITFYTGSVMVFLAKADGTVAIHADGYYKTCGA